MAVTRTYLLHLHRHNTENDDSMSDPGTTYRTREEVQRMRSTQDPIRGLQRYLEEWGVATEAELKASSDMSMTFLHAP
jgi:TPP-dependent pyruvate/acetoin dehydrogenase alpha subunit